MGSTENDQQSKSSEQDDDGHQEVHVRDDGLQDRVFQVDSLLRRTDLMRLADFVEPHRAAFVKRLARGQSHDDRDTPVDAGDQRGLVFDNRVDE